MLRGFLTGCICLAAVWATDAAAQAPPRHQPGDTVLLLERPYPGMTRVVIEASVGDSADVRFPGTRSGIVLGRPVLMDTLDVAGLRIAPAWIRQAQIREAHTARVPVAALRPLTYTRPRPSPVRPALIVGAAGGVLGAAAGAMCECNAVERGAARGAGLFAGLVLIGSLR